MAGRGTEIAHEPVMRTKHPTSLGKRSIFSFLLLASLSGISCHRPVRSGALIDAYRTADCVPPIFAKGVLPPTHGWDATITIAGGSQAMIRGADMVWGNIVVGYERDGVTLTAVEETGVTSIRLMNVSMRVTIGRWSKQWETVCISGTAESRAR